MRAPIHKYNSLGAPSDLEQDLQEWSTLFVSGRLHKPSALIEAPEQTSRLQQQNLSYALVTHND